jgi:hypothetical protein
LKNKINCFQCEHFAVTWDPKNPRGCKLFEFKSARMPSVPVKEDSGIDCLGFVPKQKKAGIPNKQ